MSARPPFFPPRPRRLLGRTAELAALTARLRAGVPRLALVGGGGSGKSLLACALGHKVKADYPGGVHWFRIGAWSATTLYEMLHRRLGLPAGGDRIAALTQEFARRGRTLVVLDNHESDRALARFLEALRASPVTWLVTARRCLLSGVEIFPVVPPLVTSHRNAFPRVAPLTRLLRWNPLALDIADRLVETRAVSLTRLQRFLVAGDVERVSVMSHEDDVVEVRLLLDWAWAHLPAAARAMLAALAHSEGDDIDRDSLYALCGARPPAAKRAGLERLRRWHLVQEPLADRFTLHAVVRQAVQSRTRFSPERYFVHYIRLLERHPERVDLEQTHLFAAMDHAHRTSNLGAAVRLERLLARLQEG